MPSSLLLPRLLPLQRSAAEAFHAHRLAETLGLAELPKGWPEHPEAFALDSLLDPPEQGPHWWFQFFLHPTSNELLGNGGYCGLPRDGEVEIGYEIAPLYRGQGWARRAVQALLPQAWSEPAVQRVVAHTLAEMNASARVLVHHGFEQVAELPNDEVGRVWRWILARPR